jgi:hypothetical protein
MRSCGPFQPIQRFLFARWSIKVMRLADLDLQHLASCTSALK